MLVLCYWSSTVKSSAVDHLPIYVGRWLCYNSKHTFKNNKMYILCKIIQLMQLLRISVWYNSLCFFNKFVYKIMENTPFMIYYSTLYSLVVLFAYQHNQLDSPGCPHHGAHKGQQKVHILKKTTCSELPLFMSYYSVDVLFAYQNGQLGSPGCPHHSPHKINIQDLQPAHVVSTIRFTIKYSPNWCSSPIE